MSQQLTGLAGSGVLWCSRGSPGAVKGRVAVKGRGAVFPGEGWGGGPGTEKGRGASTATRLQHNGSTAGRLLNKSAGNQELREPSRENLALPGFP